MSVRRKAVRRRADNLHGGAPPAEVLTAGGEIPPLYPAPHPRRAAWEAWLKANHPTRDTLAELLAIPQVGLDATAADVIAAFCPCGLRGRPASH